MKAYVHNDKISVQAVAGTHVVLLGFNATQVGRKGLAGFGVTRKDETTGKVKILRGYQYYENNDPYADSMTNPIQSFLWGDYSVKPGRNYTYTIIPLYGYPASAKTGDQLVVRVLTEDPEEATHAVFFNRGVAGSQYYSKKFRAYRKFYLQEKYGRQYWQEFIKPEDVPDNAAWEWLSRGLEQAMIGFIQQADGPDYSIRASLYELTYPPALDAFVKAMESGADVKIIHHSKTKRTTVVKKGKPVVVDGLDEVGEAAREAIRSVGIGKKEDTHKWSRLFIRRTKAQISHNKFIVLLKKGKPIQVWTGSTNITAGGIFGQSNVGHIVRDIKVAGCYLEYWNVLSKDPIRKTARNGQGPTGISNWNVDRQNDLTGRPDAMSITTIFSPRTTTNMLKWYAEQLGTARNSIHFTAAFGVSPEIGAELVKETAETSDGPVVRQVLLESRKSRKQSDQLKSKAKKAGKQIPLDYYDFIKVAGNQLAYGDLMEGWGNGKETGTEAFQQEYLTGLNTYVDYLHTKYLLVDPLTDHPLVISGSANFSDASTVSNDENMLVIQGNTRVADMFLTEFVRLFRHFQNRNVLNEMGRDARRKAVFLSTDDSWTDTYYQKGTPEYDERILFGTKKAGY